MVRFVGGLIIWASSLMILGLLARISWMLLTIGWGIV